MDYEKEHKKLVGKIKRAYLYAQTNSTKAVLEDILPELKEGKDEKIRKAIYGWIYTRPSQFFDDGFSKEEMLAWLEKQGKQTPTDKIEPKFHEGDWIISNDKKSTYQVIEVKRGIYVIRDNADNHEYHIGIEACERSGRLWNISDAKPGDVLVASDGSIFLFGGVDDSACKYYAALTADNYVKINKEAKGGYWETSRAVYPATKEQRDTLMKAMVNAGYTFDFEKKEPKKIEQKPTDKDEPKEDNRPVTERIKTFEDALEALGDEHPLVKEYWGVVHIDFDVSKDLYAYLKLRVIVAALNEGWEPKFEKGEYRYYPWFYLYTKEQYDELDDEEKGRYVLRSGNNSHSYYGFVHCNADYNASFSFTVSGSRLVFRTRELAAYAGRQFTEEWADFVFKTE